MSVSFHHDLPCDEAMLCDDDLWYCMQEGRSFGTS